MAWLNYTTLKPKDLVGIPWRVAFALQADGWYLRSDIIWHKPNPMPESVTDRPTKAHEYIFLLTKSARYYYDAAAIAESCSDNPVTRARNCRADGSAVGAKGLRGSSVGQSGVGGYATPKPCPNAMVFGDEFGNGGVECRSNCALCGGTGYLGRAAVSEMGRNKRTVWTVATQPYPEAHFATFPEALIEPCILAGSDVGQTVLDPFAGSGTTGAVAVRHGRSFVGCELNPAYLELARRRIGAVAPLLAREVA